MQRDEKQVPTDVSDDELATTANNEKAQLISSRESSSDPSDSANVSVSEDPDPRFARPSPSPLKRLALVIFLAFLFWLGFHMRSGLLERKKDSKVIYASRYSKDHKFRPAASPVITETLKDGRIRIRGALPTPTDSPTPSKKKAGTGKVSGKKKSRKSKPKRVPGAAKRM